MIFLSTRPSCKSFCCSVSVAQGTMVNSALQGAILALLVGAAVAQDDIGCFVPGQCVDSIVLTEDGADSPNECLELCKDYEHEGAGDFECNYFTYYLGTEACLLFDTCDSLETDDCDNCISGDSECPPAPCFIDDLSCIGVEIELIPDVESENDCLDQCRRTEDCTWASYFDNDACLLTENCLGVEPCDDCSISSPSNPNCDGEGDGGSDVEQINIFVMGGDALGTTGAVEVISLDDSLDCGPQTPLPFVSQEMLAVVDSEGRPLACGGTGQTPTDCVVYDEGTWVTGPSMNFARNFGPDSILLSDGRWFVTGDDNSPGDTQAEFFDGTEFTVGPDLPVGTYFHCTMEVEPGRVLVAGGRGDNNGFYIIDVDSGDVENLPDIPVSQSSGQACGVVPSESGGEDYVVAGGAFDDVYIYNTDSGTWRDGPPLPEVVIYPAYLPYGDSFIIFGGYVSGSPSTNIWYYDYEGFGWDLIGNMALGREDFAYAYVTEDVLNC